MTEEELRQIQAWVDRHAEARDELDARSIAMILALYAGVNFYDRLAVDAAAEAAADASNTAALLASGLMAQYLASVTSTLADESLPAPSVLIGAIRNGADMRQVFQRPAKLFRRQVAKGVDPAEAYRQAMALAATLVEGNNTLAMRLAAQLTLAELGKSVDITGYRRVVHPELSRSGSCGLCIVASDKVYKKAALMPIHGHCACSVLPIIGARGGAGDPGNSLNALSLGDLYELAGDSTSGADLKKVRVKVVEHGEMGPTLVVDGQKFTGPDDIAA